MELMDSLGKLLMRLTKIPRALLVNSWGAPGIIQRRPKENPGVFMDSSGVPPKMLLKYISIFISHLNSAYYHIQKDVNN